MSDVDTIAKYLSTPPSIARHILEHGLTPPAIASADIQKLSPPFSHPGIRESVEKLNKTITSRRSISVSDDGSADATAASAMLHRVLHKMGARNVVSDEKGDLHIRLRDGLQREKADIVICPHTSPPPAAISVGTNDGIASLLAFSLVHALYLAREKHFGRKLVAIDTETTGTNPISNNIIELGAARIDGNNITETFQTFINPGKRIPSSVSRITGITNEDVANAPPPAEALSKFLDFIGDAVLIAHNAEFDGDFLKRAIKKHLGKKAHFDFEDTLEMARRLHPTGSHRLGHVAERLGIKADGWHRALDDAIMAANIYITLREQQKARIMEFNLKRYMDIASLGAIASGKNLDDDCAIIIRNGLPTYRLDEDRCKAMIPIIPEKADIKEVIGLLLSWRRKKNQLGALKLLAPLLKLSTTT